MDKSLDEIISTRPRNARRGSRRGSSGRAQILGTSGVSPSTRARAAPAAKVSAVATQPQVSDRIMVSNLPQDVNEAQIKDLFHSTVGPLRDVQLYFDHSGRSKGMAQVHFQRKGDGNKAFAQYNNRLIDGKRPMKIEIVVDPSRPAAPPSLAARVAPAPVANNAVQAAAPRPRGARRARGGRVGGARKNERPAKSVADLDAEMEDYTSANAPAPVAA
ncbi:ALYREF mRNA export adapter [Pleurotus pulmonarius]